MKPRDIALRLHRWGGLGAGLVVWLLCLTGAVLMVMRPGDTRPLRLAEPLAAGRSERLPVSELLAAALEELPNGELASVQAYRDPTRAAVVQLRDGRAAFIDPWTGRVAELRPGGSRSRFVSALHTNLAAGEPGRAVVIAGTILFVLLTFLGLWLWWPAKRAARGAFLISARHGWKRFNYDAHNVLGFYSALLLLLLSVTGVLISFPRLMDAGARAASAVLPDGAGLATPGPEVGPGPQGGTPDGDVPLVDRAFAHASRLYPEAAWARAVALGGDRPRFRILVAATERFDRAHTVRVDADGVLIGVVEYGEEAVRVRFARWINQLHTARLGGGYAVLAFVACAVGTLLPLTGALIWFPRWRRARGRRTALMALLVGATLGCGDGPGAEADAASETVTLAEETLSEPADIDLHDVPWAVGLAVDLDAMIRRPSGLYIQVLREGTGPPAGPGDAMEVHYRLWLPSGRPIDSSYDRAPGEPLAMVLGETQLIDGWVEGVTGMRLGERRRLVMPHELAYGPAGHAAGIPPYSPLLYEVELVGHRPVGS